MQKIIGLGYISGHSHSSYLGLLVHSGILGLVFYLTLHVLILFKIFYIPDSNNETSLVSLFGVLAILFIGVSATAVVYTSFQWIVYFMVGSHTVLNNKVSRYA